MRETWERARAKIYQMSEGLTWYVSMALYMLTERKLSCLASSILPMLASDRGFLQRAYRDLLGREIDEYGLAYYLEILASGGSRARILVSLFKSDECLDRRIKESTLQPALPNIRALRPSRYDSVCHPVTQENVLVFTAMDEGDFDWLEAMILEHGYYEKDGIWGVVINLDKRVMAEIVAHFAPKRALEIGCANGTVMQCLYELDVFCEGVEISQLAIQRAFPEIKDNIFHGDLLALALPGTYDFIFGLDVFEHLNPNKLDGYIAEIYALLEKGGYLFCNIPVFGRDPVFGQVFPLYIDAWEQEAQEGVNFSVVEVDDKGYPIHGHLIWADSQWWVRWFERQGFQREVEIERALHEKYDDYMNKASVARKTYYVFSKEGREKCNRAIIDRICSTPSQALKGFHN